MLEGFAAMGIKYNKGKFEVVLTNVETDDVLDLLSFDAQPVKFKINKASEAYDGYREEPDNRRMFDSHGGGVENMRPVEPEEFPEESPNESDEPQAVPPNEEEEECQCETCIHLIDSGAYGEDTEIPQKKCELEDCKYEAIPETEPIEPDTPEDSEEPHLAEIQFIEGAEGETAPTTEDSVDAINLDETPY